MFSTLGGNPQHRRQISLSTPGFVDTGCNSKSFNAEIEAFYRTVANGEPLESNSSLAADAISTIYSASLSAEKRGAETTIQTF